MKCFDNFTHLGNVVSVIIQTISFFSMIGASILTVCIYVAARFSSSWVANEWGVEPQTCMCSTAKPAPRWWYQQRRSVSVAFYFLHYGNACLLHLIFGLACDLNDRAFP